MHGLDDDDDDPVGCGWWAQVSLAGGAEHVLSFGVAGERTLELTLAQFWSSHGGRCAALRAHPHGRPGVHACMALVGVHKLAGRQAGLASLEARSRAGQGRMHVQHAGTATLPSARSCVGRCRTSHARCCPSSCTACWAGRCELSSVTLSFHGVGLRAAGGDGRAAGCDLLLDGGALATQVMVRLWRDAAHACRRARLHIPMQCRPSAWLSRGMQQTHIFIHIP